MDVAKEFGELMVEFGDTCVVFAEKLDVFIQRVSEHGETLTQEQLQVAFAEMDEWAKEHMVSERGIQQDAAIERVWDFMEGRR